MPATVRDSNVPLFASTIPGAANRKSQIDTSRWTVDCMRSTLSSRDCIRGPFQFAFYCFQLGRACCLRNRSTEFSANLRQIKADENSKRAAEDVARQIIRWKHEKHCDESYPGYGDKT